MPILDVTMNWSDEIRFFAVETLKLLKLRIGQELLECTIDLNDATPYLFET